MVLRTAGTNLKQVYEKAARRKLFTGARNVEARAKRALNFLVYQYFVFLDFLTGIFGEDRGF